MEVEVKFVIPDRATFEWLCQLDELTGYRLEQAGIKRVHDRYLDTDDRAILRAGYACRVRRKEGTLIATLKGLGGADADSGIHQRAEYEVLVDGADPATWPESPARDMALRLSGGQPLRELFALSQERHLRLLYDDAPTGTRRVAELSLDVVTPEGQEAAPHVGGDEPCPYHELEIELLDQGNETDLHTMADALRAVWKLRPEPRSKFERGLALRDAVGRTTGRGNQWKNC